MKKSHSKLSKNEPEGRLVCWIRTGGETKILKRGPSWVKGWVP